MSYIKVIPVTQKFYRSAQSSDKLPGYWFGFTPNDTYNYGNITAEFNSVRDLKLIDITSQEFYNEFTNRLLAHSLSDPDVDMVKFALLFPLGYLNIEIYKHFCVIHNIKYSQVLDITVGLATQLYGNRSRHSIKEIDVLFMNYLHNIYPNCDGIIAMNKLPNTVLNGFHHAEIGIFDPNIMSQPNIIPRIISGGTINKILTADLNHNPEFDKYLALLNKITDKEKIPECIINYNAGILPIEYYKCNKLSELNKIQKIGGKSQYKRTIKRKRAH